MCRDMVRQYLAGSIYLAKTILVSAAQVLARQINGLFVKRSMYLEHHYSKVIRGSGISCCVHCGLPKSEYVSQKCSQMPARKKVFHKSFFLVLTLPCSQQVSRQCQDYVTRRNGTKNVTCFPCKKLRKKRRAQRVVSK